MGRRFMVSDLGFRSCFDHSYKTTTCHCQYGNDADSKDFHSINQNDNEERSHQVRNMRQIYSRASQVFCWAGESQSTRFPEAVKYWLDRHYENNDILSFRTESWSILNDFFRQPYWKRVWVIQEIAVATKAVVFFGDNHITWDEVARLATILKEQLQSALLPLESAFIDALHLLEIRYRFLNRRNPLGLLEAIILTKYALASDPRDKIFALLGLCHDGPMFIPVPNYKQSLNVVFSDMTKTMMSLDRSLDLMCMKGTETPSYNESGIPTWTPNWARVWSDPMTAHELQLVSQFQHGEIMADFNPVLAGSSNRILRVRGRRLGGISKLGTFISPAGSINIPARRAPWILSTSTLSQHDERLRNPTQSDIQMRDFIWQTLTMSYFPAELASQGRSCFSTLWTPEGRGLIHNLALIAWIDQNAWFEVRHWTLREWSQVTSKFIIRNDQPGVMFQIHRRVSWETTPKTTLDHLTNFIDILEKGTNHFYIKPYFSARSRDLEAALRAVFFPETMAPGSALGSPAL